MKAIHPDNCMLWIRYQSPDPHLGPKFSFCCSPSAPPSPFNSLVLIMHRSGQLENKQLRNQRAVMFPSTENLSQSFPLPFQCPGCLPSLQQPAGTLLLCYSWPACSCSYSPRLTQQQLLYVCQLASRSPKSSCPPALQNPLVLPLPLLSCFPTYRPASPSPPTSPTCHALLRFPISPLS